MSKSPSHVRQVAGMLATALLFPAGAAAQQPQPLHDHPLAATTADSTVAGRVQAMHEMMMSMHGQQGQAMPDGQGMTHGQGGMHDGQGMQGGRGMMGGQGMQGAQACAATPDARLSALLAGPVGQLALSSDQWSAHLAVLESAEVDALATLTPDQRARLEATHAACSQAATPTAPGPN